MKYLIAVVFFVVSVGYFSSVNAEEPVVAQEWRSYVESLLPVGEQASVLLRDSHDEQLRQELYEFLYSQIVAGYIAWTYADPEYPDFWPTFGQLLNQGIANPDSVYHLSPVDGGGIYRISGFRGTTLIADIQVASGDLIPLGQGNFGATLANYSTDDLQISEDGSFDFILSTQRPEGYLGDWRKLDVSATWILVRQTSYDWVNEEDGRYVIERLDRSAIKPRPSAKKLQHDLQQIATWVESWTRTSFNVAGRGFAAGESNTFSVKDWFSASGGLSDQQYLEGSFELSNDEALIITAKIPADCPYWSFQLADELWRTIDPAHRQSSLNGHTGVLDNDGYFRAVISAQDPGVPNWIDNAGYTRGLIYGRLKGCVKTETPTAEKVKISVLRDYLPKDTGVVTSEMRDNAIRLRTKGAQLRRRW